MRLHWAPSIVFLSLLVNLRISRARKSLNASSSQSQNVQSCDAIIDRYLWTYMSEIDQDGFTPLIVEDTIDERVSNLDFVHHQGFLLDKNINQARSSDSEVIEEYRRFISGPEVDQKKCTEHLQQMVNLLDELAAFNERLRQNSSINVAEATIGGPRKLDARHIRLAKVLDSYGHYSSALLEGNQDIYGMQLECLETKLQFDADRPDDLVGTRSCLAKLDMKRQASPELRGLQVERPIAINLEICIPNSCHSNSLATNKRLIQKLIDSQFIMPDSLYVHQHREIVDLFCVNDHNETIGIPTNGKVLLVLMACWLAITVYATLRNDESSLLDRYFNIKQSIDDFIGRTQATRKEGIDYDALNGIKVISTFVTIFAHTALLFATFSKDIGRVKRVMDLAPENALYGQIVLLVNTFFIMSGMVTTHIALREIGRIKGSLSIQKQFVICLRLVATRYLRIVPLYFLIYWFKRSIFLYGLSGVNRDRGYNENTWYGKCKSESWLTPVLAQAPYLTLSGQCMQQCWTLACEIKFIVVCAPLIVLMSQRPKVGLSLTALLAGASVWAQYSDYISIDMSRISHFEKYPIYTVLDKLNSYSTIHTNCRNRISTFLVATIAGYFLHRSEWDKTKQWPKWFSKYATRWAVITVFIPMITGLLQKQLLPRVPLNTTSLLRAMVFGQVIWPISNAILITRMMTDWKSSYVMQLFLGNFWHTMSKLGLTILLVHNDVIYLLQTTANSFPYSHSSFNFGSVYMNSLLLSLVVYIIFETPLEKMAKDFLKWVDRLSRPPSRSGASESKLVKDD